MVHFTRSLFLFFGVIHAVSGRPEPPPRDYKSDVCQSGQYSKYSPLAHYGPAKDYCSKRFPTVKQRVNYRRAADAEPAYRATTTSCPPAKPSQCSGKPENCLLSSIKNGPKHVAKTACSCITKTTRPPGYPKLTFDCIGTTAKLDKHLTNKGLHDYIRFFHEHLHYSIFVIHDYVHIDFCFLHEQFRDYVVLLRHDLFHDKHFRSNAHLHEHFPIDFHLLFQHFNGLCFDNKHNHNLRFIDDFLHNYIYHGKHFIIFLTTTSAPPSTCTNGNLQQTGFCGCNYEVICNATGGGNPPVYGIYNSLAECLRDLDFIPQFNSVDYNPETRECRYYQRQRPNPMVNANVPNIIARRITGSCKVPEDGSASSCGTAT
ncbi:hypothetical protein CBER1_05322 [Cercospora berteroae]|uniref:Uncharacterized protein n=1 Tax=Cercospora berteroae TaxID=357750 RepID=A0A2S6CHR5_9PEZI|nr:hypothetical protein CBER1_05322 [Cercospora berteroae]